MAKQIVLGTAVLVALQVMVASAGQDDKQNQRDERVKHLRALMIGMHNYHNDFAKMPPAVLYSEDNKPLLSWRVIILPYLGHDQLYRKFKLDEPWDTPNNKKLIAEMPDIFTTPGAPNPGKGMTYLQVFTAPEKTPAGKKDQFQPAFKLGPKARKTLGQITVQDGTSNTVGIAEAAKAVIWTKPADMLIEHDEAPLPGLGCVAGEDDFGVVYLDGTVRFLRRTLPDKKEHEKLLREVIGVNDGMNFDKTPLIKEEPNSRRRR